MYLIKIRIGKPTCPLFPNLRRLHWLGHNTRNLEFIDMFLSPALEELSIYLPDQEQAGRVLNRLYEKNLNLKALYIETAPFVITHRDVTLLTFLLGSYATLTTLELQTATRSYTIDVDTLWFLAEIPSLESLSVELSSQYLLPWMPNLLTHIPSPFPSLQILSLTWQDKESAPIIKTFISALSSKSLLKIELHIRYDVDVSDLLSILQALSHHSMVNKVKVIHRVFEYDDDSDWDIPIEEEILHDLFALSHMRKLYVEGFSVSFTDDGFIEDMGTCWQLIEEVVFVEVEDILPEDREDIVDIRSFSSLATHCPHLRTLHIPWKSDLENPNDIDLPVQVGFRHPISLQYGWAPIKNAMVTAAFLVTVFKNVCLVERRGTYVMALRQAMDSVVEGMKETGLIDWNVLDYTSWDDDSLWNDLPS